MTLERLGRAGHGPLVRRIGQWPDRGRSTAQVTGEPAGAAGRPGADHVDCHKPSSAGTGA